MNRLLPLLAIVVFGHALDAQPQRVVESFDSNNVKISYTDESTGQPVVLIHGFTGSASRHFDRPGITAALRAGGYRVIALDCRGHGQSEKPAATSQYGMEMVRDVIRLLDHLKIARVHIVGYSMGGGIAQQVLVTYPNRVFTVTLLGSGWEGEHLPALTAQMNSIADGFERMDASALIRGVNASPQSGPSDAEIAAATADLFSRNDPHVLAAVARSLPVLWRVSRQQLQAVRLPVLAIDGEDDRNNLEAAQRMVGVVRDFELVELPGVNHATSVQPSAAHIVKFLDKHGTH